MKHLFLGIGLLFGFVGTSCQFGSAGKTAATHNGSVDNLLYTAKKWTPVTDKLGSSFSPEHVENTKGQMEVNFTLKKKEAGEIVFIELVCDLGHSLVDHTGLSIDYRCETPLVIKLSQSDFGKDGNESYAHYQFVVPASETITTAHLKFSAFTQPGWTPVYAAGIPLKLENVDAIYLTPKVDDSTGGSSLLGVQGLFLSKE